MFNQMLDSITQHEYELQQRLKTSDQFFSYLKGQMQSIQDLITCLETDFAWVNSHSTGLVNSAQGVKDSTVTIEHNFATVAAQVKDGADVSRGNIQNITSTIDSLAFQTSLLSINASVEAARAGENGKGFSVVATEVGRLAKDTKTAAHDISSQIERLGMVLEEAVTGISAEAEHLNTIGHSAGETSSTVGELIEKISTIQNGFQQMLGQVQGIFTHYDQNMGIEQQENHQKSALVGLTQ